MLGRRPSLDLFWTCFSLKRHPRGGGWWYFLPRSQRKIVLGVSSSIHRWKERFFFVTAEEVWGFEVVWCTPRMDLNSPIGLGQEEAESLAHLLECPYSAFELLEEEALVNASLSSTKLGGNSLLVLSLAFLR